MNSSIVIVTIKDIRNLYHMTKASGALDLDEITIQGQSKEHVPTEDGETYDSGYVVFTWGNVEFKVFEANEDAPF